MKASSTHFSHLDASGHARMVDVGPKPTLVAERLPLQQVLMNLVGNAVSYTRRPEARVEVSAAESGAIWEFSVRDNGPGSAPE